MRYRLLAAVIAVLCAASPAFAASSYSSCERLENPVPGDPAVRNAWGTIENTGRSLIDTAVAGTISLSVAGSSNVTLTAADGGADQARNAHYIFTGALTGNISVFWPVYCRAFSVFNNTSGAFTLTVAVTGTPGTTVAVPQGSTMLLVSDGTNISQRIAAIPNASLSNNSITIAGASTALGGTVTAGTIQTAINALDAALNVHGNTYAASGMPANFTLAGIAGAQSIYRVTATFFGRVFFNNGTACTPLITITVKNNGGATLQSSAAPNVSLPDQYNNYITFTRSFDVIAPASGTYQITTTDDEIDGCVRTWSNTMTSASANSVR